MTTISIQQVLSELSEASGRTFLIAFVRSTGKNRGSIKVVAKAVRGAPIGHTPRTGAPTRRIGLHKDNHTLPITDTERNEYLSPKISHIIQFNQFKVLH